ncbi:hypothetical protein KIL84_013039 [Mauremys mutica]|uniref:Uncharacterized protein n=1 Tax=Mauremys mutica TaxID=74926 RepID=A0A9D4B8F2_9SAUR|nr:hypothetical protein KIL84_013039 [Mauremys mutica]
MYIISLISKHFIAHMLKELQKCSHLWGGEGNHQADSWKGKMLAKNFKVNAYHCEKVPEISDIHKEQRGHSFFKAPPKGLFEIKCTVLNLQSSELLRPVCWGVNS